MIEIVNLSKTYSKNSEQVHALRNVNLSIGQGEFISIIGPSGSGKSTLMNILGCLDKPTDGSYFFCGEEIKTLGGKKMAVLRNKKIGFIFQSFNLVSTMTALENVELPLVFRGSAPHERNLLARRALEQMGLQGRLNHKPSELSGGQQQRVAIARVLVSQPQLILADEPTGNLDVPSGENVMEILEDIGAQGKTVVLITHDMAVAARAKRIIKMENGRITSI